MNTLTKDDIKEDLRDKVGSQSYEKKTIAGVQIFTLKHHITEDGAFEEILRLKDGKLELVPEMPVEQINRSIMLPGTIKAWHLHFNQDEVWNVGSRTHILLGLWDIREHSETKGVSLKIPMEHNTLVYIPRGVAHGAANYMMHAGEVFYFVSNKYNPENPDENRLEWDSLGKEFWEVKKE